ncbi:transmembrane protein 17B-like [Acanthaster planci]|uniref:Transmembrane protein 17B-like n=1 Tax=Acanthaster planci TaxID=133434 RepID=A0A8B7ZVQ1_ACAPL|nr:transmembrane protein 17B-like [Acanthaster planci]
MAADYMRQKLTSFSEAVFPGRALRDNRQHHAIRPGNELVSNLPLQMALYFNVFFFPFWLVCSIVLLELKFYHLDEIFRFVCVTIYVVMGGTEIMRLYLGYLGNLQERVPELAGSWLLTLILQFPLIIFLLAVERAMPVPVERAVHLVQLTFIVLELVFGFLALRVMTQHQIMKFHLQDFDTIFDLEEGHQEVMGRYTPLA